MGERFIEVLQKHKPFAQAVDALWNGKSISVDGAVGGACALAVAAMVRPQHPPLLVLTSTWEQADRIADDLELFAGKTAMLFPALENLPKSLRETGGRRREAGDGRQDVGGRRRETGDEDDTPEYSSVFALSDDLFGQRIRTLKNLMAPFNGDVETGPNVIVSSITGLIQPVPTPQCLHERTQILRVGDQVDLENLRRFLTEAGFHGTTAVDLPGEFAVRGYILDLFMPDWNQPVRIEFFDTEIESIRRFDVSTQRSLESVHEISLTRLLPDEAQGANLLDYIPQSSPVILIEPVELDQAGRTYLERLGHPTALPTVSDVLRRVMTHSTASFSRLAEGLEDTHIRLPVHSVERFHGNIETIRRELDLLEKEQIYIFCPTEAETQRLSELFVDLKSFTESRLHLVTGRLSAGFKLQSQVGRKKIYEDIVLIGAGELLERQDIRRPKRRQLVQTLDSFLDLKPGDFVVHVAHGIARFQGITTLTKGQQEEEHLHLEFAEGQSLYVPISKIGLVQKYVAGSRHKPKLAKYGGTLWARHKKTVQEAVFDLAEEMIDLQARREAQPGIAFPHDSDWQREFDASFPFRETEDQLTAIEDVKRDMERGRPMDRLLCGDVGFGKTEVAIRAAFKAVDSGYQVAILVPTTILAEQHRRTFSERMREFPITVAAMSRFQSKLEQKQIVDDLASGKVDVVVGTHRIVSADIRFHNLGLVVIDEEQRFGVAHKERLKALRDSVDVLTMTATPIPRTLHFSLLGIREISNLETPPEDRLAVRTRVQRFDDQVIRTAVLRELNRGGQIYFVHNRVYDIQEFAARIRLIVPECRIQIGHAQMKDDELESVMNAFIRHEFDMLISTTIIESGLDIPNANTMFIDEADRYGLADLHQLRGRVGRYKHQAYCYLLLGRHQLLNSQAAKRLHAIEEYAHLGSGFHLAMRDLEIRGAGNILGTQQSGHIATVGYEMYCQFLEAAVRTLKQLPPKASIDVELDLPGSGLIPVGYVADQRVKIDLYRRLPRVTTLEEWSDFQNEILDRFGPPPSEVCRLLTYAKIRVLAHGYRIRSIRLESGLAGDSGYVVFEYVSIPMMNRLIENLAGGPITIRLTGDRRAYVPMPQNLNRNSDPDDILQLVLDILL